MQRWANFIARHPNAHVLLGRTRDITQWRNNALAQLIAMQRPSGKVSMRRSLDDAQGYLLILVGFENRADAATLAQALRAKEVEAHGGYGTVFEFDPVLVTPVQKRKTLGSKSSPVILGGP